MATKKLQILGKLSPDNAAGILRVSVDENLDEARSIFTCHSTASEIHEALQNGKTVILDDTSDGISRIYNLSYSDPDVAFFVWVNTDDELIYTFSVYNEYTAYFTSYEYAIYKDGQLYTWNQPTEDNHVTNKAYVDNAVEGARATKVSLISYLDDGTRVCDNTSRDIYDFLKGGKAVYLTDENNGDMYYGLIYCDENAAIFGYYSVEDYFIKTITIYSDGNAYERQQDLVFYEEDGNLTVLDEPKDSNHAASKAYVDNAVKGKSYELIETITLEEDVASVERTKEPDGTTYNFDALMIEFEMAAAASAAYIGANMRMIGGGDIGFYISGGISTNTTRTTVYAHSLYGKAWGIFSKPVTNTWDVPNSWHPPIYGRLAMDFTSMDKIRITGGGTVPAGSVIKIWGVRADA